MQTGYTGADLVTNFISTSIAVMWTTVRMTELQAMRVATASNGMPTEFGRAPIRHKCSRHASVQIPHNNETPAEQTAPSFLSFILFLASSSIFCSLYHSFHFALLHASHPSYFLMYFYVLSISLLLPLLISFSRPLWSSGQSCWLQIRRPGFDSRHYQKKKYWV
jgi:hypothetical protein